jgi:hypothetical protein
MPEETKKIEGEEGFDDTAAHNDETKRKLEAQGAPKVTKPEELVEASDALDKLAAEKSKKTDETAAAEAAAKEKAAAEAAGTPESKVAAEKAAKEAEETKKKAEQTEVYRKKADEFFKDSPGLPANASPKSSEAFSTVKIRAAQEISARDQKIDELDKQLKGLNEKLKSPIPPELEKEVSELRTWRAKLDVDADPKFKEFDKQVSTAQEFIYSQLKKSSVITDEVIEEIKKYGGPEKVNMTKIFDAIKDPMTQRLIESKLADIEMTQFNKAAAIKSVKENLGQYMTERQKAFEQAASGHNSATQKYLGELTGKLDWFKPQKAADNADETAKQVVKDHNEFVTHTQKQIEAALKDDSPEMRAIMLTGMAQLFHLQRVHEAEIASGKKKDATLTEKDATIKELTEKLDRLKSAGTSRMRESAAPASGNLPKAKKDIDMTPAGDALDALARQVIEERARAAGAGA